MSHFGYVPANTFIHRLNPALKLLILIFVVSIVIIYPSWVLGILFLLVILVSFKIAKVPVQLKSGRVKFLLFFSIFLFIIQILVTINGSIILFVIPEINGIGSLLPITDFGIEKGTIMTTRFLIVVFSSMFFVSVTDPTLLAHSLTRLKVPYRYSFTLIIALRFLPLFDLENNT
ncbi:MAG: energy-coupling factor transporter transmembrane component T family protein, partial [Candidatus Thorarchaeota archaeon]